MELHGTKRAHDLPSERAVGMDRIEEHAEWRLLARLPMVLTSGVPLARFKLRHLLQLSAGQTLLTTWSSTEDVPLKMGDVQIGWTEFEVVEQRMAVRLTRLA